MEAQSPSHSGAVSPESQEKMTSVLEVTKGNNQCSKHENQPLQQVGDHPLREDASMSGMALESAKVDEESRDHEAHRSEIAAETKELATEPCSNEAQTLPGPVAKPQHALEASGDHDMSVIDAQTTEDKKQSDEQAGKGKKSSNGPDQKRAAKRKVLDNLIDEEAELERRIGDNEEKPNDKARLSVVKQELERYDAALRHGESIEEANAEEEIAFVQNAMGDPVGSLRATSRKKTSTARRKTTNATAKKRKSQAGNSGGPAKKRKPNNALKVKDGDIDAISKHMFDQLQGRGAAADKEAYKKTLPSVRSLGKIRSGDLKKLREAAKNVEQDDPDVKRSIEVDIQVMVIMTKPFGQSCTLKLLQGDEKPDEERSIDDYAWAIKGMETPLRHHQLMAAGFMCNLERQGKYCGGLLFDYMGYGKTVESLALIAGNPAKNVSGKLTSDSDVATTLVVVPTAAAQQWAEEVNIHCPDLTVSSWTKTVDKKVLVKSDIIIVTYSEVRTAYTEAIGTKRRVRKKGKGKGKEKGKEKEKEGNEDSPEPVLGHPLYETVFHRVVLDEVHEIKGYPNQTCDAVMALNSKFRWGMTGTPTPNGLEELYPYLKFIKHPEITTMGGFKDTYICGNSRIQISEEERYQNLRELLMPVMLRRTPWHSFLGTSLLKLPPSHPMPPIRVRLSAEERIIYRFIEENIRKRATKKPGGQETEVVSVNLLNESLLRLRQCVSSPLLLEKLATKGLWSVDQVASMRQEARDAGSQTTPFIDQIGRWAMDRNLREASTTPQVGIPNESLAHARALLETHTCPGTGCEKTMAELVDPEVAECGHVWCKVCLEKQDLFERIINNRETPECSRCHKPLGQAKPFSPAEPGDEVAEAAPTLQRRPGEDKNGKRPRNIIVVLDHDPTGKVPRSAKVDAVIRQIITWQKEAPDDKIIVFIQWIGLNGILGRILQEEGIEFLYYTGTTEMNEKDRKAAIETFKNDPSVKVLLCSLRCGGQALNLTCANRTIMVDLWWNQSVETQATARVYRMGQQKETYSVRVIVEESVDEKIYALQETKLEALGNAFQEFEAENHFDRETLCDLLGLAPGDYKSGGDASYVEECVHSGDS